MNNNEPFTFAGLWDCWKSNDENLLSATIITTEPNELMMPIHNRMPVILPDPARELWLSASDAKLPELISLLIPYQFGNLICSQFNFDNV